MKAIITSIVCLFFSLIVTANDNLSRIKDNDEQIFNSFLTNFDQFKKPFVDASIFYGRNLRHTDNGMPNIDTNKFNDFVPYDSLLNCKREQIVYRPGYKQKVRDIIVVGIVGFCKNEISEVNILVTYEKTGKIIDYEYLGFDGTYKYYVLENSANNQSIIYTQYTFKDTQQQYSGKCDVSVSKIKINDDGIIDKETISEYEDNLTIEM